MIMMTKNKGDTMKNNARRDFLKLMGLTTTAAALGTSTLNAATTKPHVIVVGGGYSGSTCAKYLKMWGGSSVEVTLIEPNANYVSPILSNLVLNGQRSISQLTFNYTTHNSKYNINIIHQSVTGVDKTNKEITLANGQKLSFDKLVLAPGIDFKFVNNYDITKVPHAWVAGSQTTILKNQIDSLQSGDSFIMTIPKSPYRCPPGPYERACVIADYLKNIKGLNVNITVLDANSDFTVEKDSFSAKFNEYGIDYRTNCDLLSVDDTAMSITFSENGTQKTLSATVLNVIPNQKAAKIIFDAGVNSGDWAPVDLRSYESTIAQDIYIIGDSHKSTQPKAGHIGNGEAKICADAILRSLNNIALYPTPKTTSACYSPVSTNEATWLAAVFEYQNGNMVLVKKGSGAPSTINYNNMFNWSGNLFSDTFQ